MSPTTWFKVDDGLAFHPKAIAAGNSALGLWVRAGAWCSGNLTDGWMPVEVIALLGGQRRDALRLVDAGLWIEVAGNDISTTSQQDRHNIPTGSSHDHGTAPMASRPSRVKVTGYRFLDWQDWQPTKAQVTAEREATKKRVSRWRDAHRNDVSNGVTNGVSNGVGTPAPSRPVPSRSGLGSQSPDPHHPGDQSDGLDLDRIKTALRTNHDQRAAVIASNVLAKAPRPPGNPTAYVVNAILREPHLYRETSGPPALGELCDTHGRDRATCPASWHEEGE